MDLDEAFGKLSEFNIKDHCHVNTNEDGDRFVGIKADTDDAMVYFPYRISITRRRQSN